MKPQKGQIMEKWSFSNGNETRVIPAIDSPSAWKELAKVVGVKMWHGGFEIPLPHAWNINCVCCCGKAQATRYCSKACYEKAVKSGAV